MINSNDKIINFSTAVQLKGIHMTTKKQTYHHALQRTISDFDDYGTIDEKEESIMPENNTYTKTEIDLKFQILEQKIDHLPTTFENMLLRNNELLEANAKERQKESSNKLMRFISIIIALASIGVSIAQHFLSK